METIAICVFMFTMTFTMGILGAWLMQDIKNERRKKAKWLIDEFGARCSSCGNYANMSTHRSPILTYYCGNCGAKMEVNK